MRLVQIARYPVKSLQGEVVARAEIEATGLLGDRCWGIRDERTGKILTARREPRLLFAAAALQPDGEPLITLPTGFMCQGVGASTHAALSDWLGKPVRLVSSVGEDAAEAEYFADATDDASEAIGWTMPAGRFVDAQPLLVMTTASLRAAAALYPHGDWNLRRLRANLVVDVADDGWLEDDWCGRSIVHVDEVQLQPNEPCIRCTMVTRRQPGLDEDRDIFRTLARHHNARFGVWSSVVVGGTVRIGDSVRVVARPTTPPFGEPFVGAQRSSEENEPRPSKLP